VQTDLLSEIERIQQIEQRIYNRLQTEDMSDLDIDKAMNKLSQLATIKRTLYVQLDIEYKRYTEVGDLTTDLLREQKIALSIIDQQIADTKKHIQQTQEEALQQQRMAAIHDSLTAKYHAYSKISLVVIGLCLAIIVATILGSILGTWATVIMILGILGVTIYYVVKEDLLSAFLDKHKHPTFANKKQSS
jgi:uncharacterized membrane protein